jgi:hypothetical protein
MAVDHSSRLHWSDVNSFSYYHRSFKSESGSLEDISVAPAGWAA